MNKIYKVVWNKARNCYVVASEFAKNHQTGSSRIKAASVAAVMAATMLTIGTGVIYAADDVTDTRVKLIKERECKIVCVNRYCMNLLYAPYWGKQR